MRRTSNKKKWFFAGFTVVSLTIIFVLAVEPFGEFPAVEGTMKSKSTVSLENMQGNWLQGSNGQYDQGSLDDVFGMSVNAINQSGDYMEEHVMLFFSRDENFSTEEDCLVDQKDIVVEPSGAASVDFHSTARLVDCLDAGPWYVAVHSTNGGWSALEQVYHVAGGDAEVEIDSVPSDVTPRGTMELNVLVHREATATGYDGLYDFPVDVWLKQGETLCIIEAQTFSVPRDPAASWNQSWKASSVALNLDLREAKKVDGSKMTRSPFSLGDKLESGRNCENCTPPEKSGACSLSEGPLQITAGPSASGFHVVQETYHHASPVVVQTGKLQVSVKAGEVLQVSRTAYNPSVKNVSWTSRSMDGEDWLIGMKDQTLPARKPSEVGFTVSALDLEPGVYETTVLVSASDFYHTEAKLDVEVTVLPSRMVVQEEVSEELPASFSLGNYPNPFNPTTTIRFELVERGQTSLTVYDVSGRQVRILHDGELGSGLHEFRFDAGDLPSGTYLYRLTTPSASKTEKMVLLK